MNDNQSKLLYETKEYSRRIWPSTSLPNIYFYEYSNGDVTEVGQGQLAEPSVKTIVDAVSQIYNGQNADEFSDGHDPYEGQIVQVLDGWVVLKGNGEGDLYMIHAQES